MARGNGIQGEVVKRPAVPNLSSQDSRAATAREWSQLNALNAPDAKALLLREPLSRRGFPNHRGVMENEKQKPLPIKILVGQPFIQVPRFWVDSLMSAQWHLNLPNGGKRNGPRIPGSFWKYSLVLWRCIQGGNLQRKTTMAMSQFPVRSDAAVRWTAAYSVSGLFDVEMGKYTANHDSPTEFVYRTNAEQVEWVCFIQALDFVLWNLKTNPPRFKDKQLKVGSNTGAFKVCVALKVDELRVKAGLPPVNDKFLTDAAAGRILDSFRRPIARIENEKIVPVFYHRARLQRKGESDDDFDKRLMWEAAEEDQQW